MRKPMNNSLRLALSIAGTCAAALLTAALVAERLPPVPVRSTLFAISLLAAILWGLLVGRLPRLSE